MEEHLAEIKASTKEIPPAKTWAQIASANTSTAETARAKRREMQAKLKKDRAPYEVTLTTADDETKNALSTLSAKEIAKRCQDFIYDTANINANLNGINKITNGIRLQCKTPSDADVLRTVDWKAAFDGLEVHKPKYGIVVHGIPTKDLEDLNKESVNTELIQEWEAANDGLKIKKIKYLRRKPRANREPANQSVIVFTEDPYAADKCIRFGFFINSLHHKAERYAPQLHVNQCYKCFDYSHRATHCKRKEKCGHCGTETHLTAKCQATEHCCCACKGNHQAWSPLCPERDAESQRLKKLRMETSPFFTS
jgi:hypothetical protein